MSGLMFPKTPTKKKRMRHAKSILQEESDHRCFLCMLEGNYQEYPMVHRHHVFYGNPRKQRSEEYGLTVKLCVRHHEFNKDAVHGNQENNERLKRIAQEAFEKTHTRSEFINIFGKSYL